MPYKVLIVDDEPPARAKIRHFLEEDPRFQVIGEAEDGDQAVAMIGKNPPDLVFLDIQMPVLTGFGVIESVGIQHMPALIFTTAYDQFALKAFDVNATDYLLKPFDRDRFNQALDRTIQTLENRTTDQSALQALLDQIRTEYKEPLKRIVIKDGRKMVLLKTEDITHITSEEKYIRLHTATRSFLHRETMAHISSRLDHDRFVRIHRGALINLDHLAEIEPHARGDHLIIMDTGAKLMLSRNYKDPFFQRFQS